MKSRGTAFSPPDREGTKMKNVLILSAVIVLVIASAGDTLAKKKDLEGIPLVWKPTTELGEKGAVNLTGLDKVRIRVETLSDNRENPDLIGENLEDEDKGTVLRVTTSDRVADFVSKRMTELLGDMGLEIVDEGGDVIIGGEVKKFFVEERNTYQSDVSLKIRVLDAEGNTLWAGLTGGSAKRFGRSLKAENYYETLCDGLIDAVYALFEAEGFREALASPVGGSAE